MLKHFMYIDLTTHFDQIKKKTYIKTLECFKRSVSKVNLYFDKNTSHLLIKWFVFNLHAHITMGTRRIVTTISMFLSLVLIQASTVNQE